MATRHLIHRRSVHLAQCLKVVGVALALVLSVLAIDAVMSTGLITRTVTVETETFDVVAKHSPLKFVPPSPRAQRAQ
jgi:hypothetical protein